MRTDCGFLLSITLQLLTITTYLTDFSTTMREFLVFKSRFQLTVTVERSQLKLIYLGLLVLLGTNN